MKHLHAPIQPQPAPAYAEPAFHIPNADWECIALARELRRRRLGHGWTLDLCAQKSGVARQTIAFIETGRRIPRIDTLIRLARGLECSLADLFAAVAARAPAHALPARVTSVAMTATARLWPTGARAATVDMESAGSGVVRAGAVLERCGRHSATPLPTYGQ